MLEASSSVSSSSIHLHLRHPHPLSQQQQSPTCASLVASACWRRQRWQLAIPTVMSCRMARRAHCRLPLTWTHAESRTSLEPSCTRTLQRHRLQYRLAARKKTMPRNLSESFLAYWMPQALGSRSRSAVGALEPFVSRPETTRMAAVTEHCFDDHQPSRSPNPPSCEEAQETKLGREERRVRQDTVHIANVQKRPAFIVMLYCIRYSRQSRRRNGKMQSSRR